MEDLKALLPAAQMLILDDSHSHHIHITYFQGTADIQGKIISPILNEPSSNHRRNLGFVWIRME